MERKLLVLTIEVTADQAATPKSRRLTVEPIEYALRGFANLIEVSDAADLPSLAAIATALGEIKRDVSELRSGCLALKSAVEASTPLSQDGLLNLEAAINVLPSSVAELSTSLRDVASELKQLRSGGRVNGT